MAVNEAHDPNKLHYENPFFQKMMSVPGLSVAMSTVDQLMAWGSANSLWIFPMATSCCGIEFMAAAASRVDLDRIGSIARGSPKQCDVMVVAGTITVKMAPRVKKLWDLMPEPKWCLAMGSCAISGDFYRDIYSVIPGIDTVVPVDVYVPGCPPNPEQLMAGLMRLQEKIKLQQQGKWTAPETRPETEKMIVPEVGRLWESDRNTEITEGQISRCATLGLNGNEMAQNDEPELVQIRKKGDQIPTHLSFAANPSKKG
ncbi:MAG: NADH-quinone oxidoreductase subunit NuoB [Myxococcota bacterium]|nr:NADH-quinone oxidoreductase subunit NuoB [Myxococcota bacterium]